MPESSAKESACSRNNYRQAADYQQAARGEMLGPIWQRSSVSDARNAAPSVNAMSGQVRYGCPGWGKPDVQEKSNYVHIVVQGFALVLCLKAGQRSLLLNSVWPLSASSAWHGCSNFNGGCVSFPCLLLNLVLALRLICLNCFLFLTRCWLSFYC